MDFQKMAEMVALQTELKKAKKWKEWLDGKDDVCLAATHRPIPFAVVAALIGALVFSRIGSAFGYVMIYGLVYCVYALGCCAVGRVLGTLHLRMERRMEKLEAEIAEIGGCVEVAAVDHDCDEGEDDDFVLVECDCDACEYVGKCPCCLFEEDDAVNDPLDELLDDDGENEE